MSVLNELVTAFARLSAVLALAVLLYALPGAAACDPMSCPDCCGDTCCATADCKSKTQQPAFVPGAHGVCCGAPLTQTCEYLDHGSSSGIECYDPSMDKCLVLCGTQVAAPLAYTDTCGPAPVNPVTASCSSTGTLTPSPVDTFSGTSFERVVDVSMKTSQGTFEFVRQWTSNASQWGDYAPLVGVPKPFGASPTSAGVPEWTHNALSVLTISEVQVGNPIWTVRDNDGQIFRFDGTGCTTYPCFARPYDTNSAIVTRLQRTSATSYFFWDAKGERTRFDKSFVVSADPVQRIFPSQVLGSTGVARLTYTYQVPSGLSGCPVGAAGTAAGVPYLYEIDTGSGKLRFSYAKLTRSAAPSGDECVIRSLTLVKPDATTELAVTYAYVVNVAERPGQLLSATIGPVVDPARTEQYAYSPTYSRTVGSQIVSHSYAAGKVSSETTDGTLVSFSGWSTTSCSAGSNCCGENPRTVTLSDARAQRGDGTVGSAGLSIAYLSLSNDRQQHSPRNYEQSTACSVSNACSSGTTRHEWACTFSSSELGHEKGYKNKRDNWEAYAYATQAVGSPPRSRLEKTSVVLGATSADGANALETRNYAYTYGTNEQQLLSSMTQLSSIAGAGTATVKSWYDPTTNRRTKLSISGYTRDITGSAQGAPILKNAVVFFNTKSACLGVTTADPLDRVLEVDGPCEIAAAQLATATACPAGTAYPVTAYEYWPSSDATERRNRLKAIHKYVNGSTTCSSGVKLSTIYNKYDARGNATSVTNASGVETTYVFDADNKMVSRIIDPGANQLEYSLKYESNGELAAVRLPQLNGEVFCYRSASNADCSTGTVTQRLQWKAKKSCTSGSSWACSGAWSERVDYTYAPDGNISAADYRTCVSDPCNSATDGESRRVERFQADAQHRPTYLGVGDAAKPGAYSVPQFFDRADNVAGIGVPFNSALSFSAFCGGPDTSGGNPDDPTSKLCSRLKFDRAERLSSLTQYATAATAGVMTCFGYDARGKVNKVSQGCSSCLADGSCSGQPSASYEWDDFGNVIQYSAVGQGSTSAQGSNAMQYDIAGNLIRHVSPDQQSEARAQIYEYDQIGRRTAEKLLTGSIFKLYETVYDSSAPPVACGTVARQKGRAARRVNYSATTGLATDYTWYSYDVAGRIIAEIRSTNSAGTCTSNVDSSRVSQFTYSKNGNLVAIRYPHGRTVSYVFGSGIHADRVSAVTTKTWTATGWSASDTDLLTNVSWEPYGGLRGYQIQHKRSPVSTTTVEYMLGGDGTTMLVGAGLPGSGASSDKTGRLKSLRAQAGVAALGTLAGNILRKNYVWQGDQVTQIDTYVNNEAAALREDHGKVYSPGYDGITRLRSADVPSFGTTGGYQNRLEYAYDSRGNRTVRTVAVAFPDTSTFAPQAWLKDRVVSSSPGSPFTSYLGRSYSYDADGRVNDIYGPVDSAGSPTRQALLAYDARSGSEPTAGLTNAGQWGYPRDESGRRLAKIYPTGGRDEFYYDLSGRLVEDRGQETLVGTATHVPFDEYVWLDNHAVAVLRSQTDLAFTTRNVELSGTTTCSRNDELALCDFYFPINDHVNRPVVVLDSLRRIVGVAEYDPFGRMNRGEVWAESAHPYSNAEPDPNLSISEPTRGLQVDMRAYFSTLDTEQNCSGVAVEGPSFWDATGSTMYGAVGGFHRGSTWTSWYSPSSAAGVATIKLRFGTYTGNCAPNDCSCVLGSGSQNYPYSGYAMREIEYRRHQAGTYPFFPALRLPGQYYDAETGLYEGWHRTYDPVAGRYLQVEPLLQSPGASVAYAGAGFSVPIYAYALNNPLAFIDATGFGSVRIENNPFLEGLVTSYLASAQGASVASLIAQSPYDVNVTNRSMNSRTTKSPILGDTLPDDTVHAPKVINIKIDELAIDDYNNGLFPDKPKSFHPLSEFVAHEFGHVSSLIASLNGGIVGRNYGSWFKYVGKAGDASACAAGREWREYLGLPPAAHAECANDCR